MATMDRLMKSFEALKVAQPVEAEDDLSKKREVLVSAKEKVMHCGTIADSICSTSVRAMTDFPKVLGLAIDTFLLCCDDENSDVRLMADECLNRTIKTLLDSHLGRLLVELFKEIKKEGSTRRLRIALMRFGDICHLMRPQKCRPYTVNLVPTFAKISQRKDDDSLQETLATVMTKVMPVIGQFTNDKDIKMLLKAFLPNLMVTSAIVRRAASISLTCICKYSRRPSSFYSWLLMALFDMILPVQEERPVYTILGVFLCFRHLIPSMIDVISVQSHKDTVSTMQTEEEMCITKEQILKVYELCLYFVRHSDHNVVTATLEALFQLLKSPPRVLKDILLSPEGITKSSIYETCISKLNRGLSESQTSVLPSSSLDESCLEDEHDLYIAEKRTKDLCAQSDAVSCYDSLNENSSYDSGSIGCSGDVELDPSKTLSMHQNDSEKCDSSSASKETRFLRRGLTDECFLDGEDNMWEKTSLSSYQDSTSEIEFKVEDIGYFTDADVPLKYCIRLISSLLLSGNTGTCTSDSAVRISVKSLALSCLSNIFSMYPLGFFLPFHAVAMENECFSTGSQKISDVTLYEKHSDPHLRGQLALLIGSFLGAALREAGGYWTRWLTSKNIRSPLFIEHLISILRKVVLDKSSVASKLALVGMKQCLNMLLNSYDGLEGLSLLYVLLDVKNSGYWLSKVELTEIISTLSFRVSHYLESNKSVNYSVSKSINFQERILNDILVPLLGDEDFRVRQAAAISFAKLIPKLYFPTDQTNKDPIIAIAKENINNLLDIPEKAPLHFTMPLVHASVKPFLTLNSPLKNEVIDASLSRVINLLVSKLKRSSNKYFTYGCYHALSLISEEYLVTVYESSWNALQPDIYFLEPKVEDTTKLPKNVSSMSALLYHLLSAVSSTRLCHDLIAHQHALQLTGNLLCGTWHKFLVELHDSSLSYQQKENSPVFQFVEALFQHLMRVLNIFIHVVEDQSPHQLKSGSSLPSLPTAPSLSPIKRKNKSKEDLFPATPTGKGSPNRSMDKTEAERVKVTGKNAGSVGQFHSLPLYLKLYDILKGAFGSYKISPDFHPKEKAFLLLRCTLNVMSQILELSENPEMGKNAEEILSYLKSLIILQPSPVIQCVKQLLKCLFGTNLASLSHEAQLVAGMKSTFGSSRMPCLPGLYNTIISYPYAKFAHSFADWAVKGLSADANENLISFGCLNWVKYGNDKTSCLLKSGSKVEKANLAAHIRLFETVVIRALQQYTISSDVYLQCEVLDLLAQLVQLRVNYCLLDADQIFIGFVIKQFDFIEEGQILNADILIPRIFYFLILLSYERYHSKPIISVPKILQLCDGLIASGQSAEKYVVPALKPVVEDLFLIRSMNKMDMGKELDAQREVVISMLFKLVHYPQVLDLFCLIICHSQSEGEDKWRKTSRQIIDVILPMLSRQQISIESQNHLNILHKLFESVASNVFRPVDILLKALFSQPKDLAVISNMHRWMSLVLAVLKVLISQGNEEAVLSRLSDMELHVNIYKLGFPCYRCERDNSAVWNCPALSPSTMFARFLFQIIGVIAEALCNLAYSSLDDNSFLCQLTSHLLLYVTHFFQSGSFRRLTTSAMSIVKEDLKSDTSAENSLFYSIADINDLFLKLTSFHPTLVLQWCNIMTLLNCDNQLFWSRIISPNHEKSDAQLSSFSMPGIHFKQTFHPCNAEMVRRGGILLLCDYVCENSTDVFQMTWIIVNHVCDIIDLSLEPTVKDFINTVHQNQAASGLWVQAMINAHEGTSQYRPSFWKKALNCLENIHFSHAGKFLKLLVENFFAMHQLSIARASSRLACKMLENVLSDPSSYQINIEDIDYMISKLQVSELTERHKDFVSRCEKLRLSFTYEVLPSSSHDFFGGSCEETRSVEFKKEQYLKLVRQKCFHSYSVDECAHLLCQLKYEDIVGIMSSKEFQPSIFEMCLRLGTHLISCESFSTIQSNDPFVGVTEGSGRILYRAAQNTLLQHLTDFMTILPRSLKHHSHLQKIFSDDSFWELLSFLAPTICSLLKSLDNLPFKSIPQESWEDIALLGVVCCEALVWIMESGKRVSLDFLKTSLLLMENTLKNSELIAVIGVFSNVSWIFSAVSSVHGIVNLLIHHPTFAFKKQCETSSVFKRDQVTAVNSHMSIVELISWIESSGSDQIEIGEQIFLSIKGIISGLARLDPINSFALIPTVLWHCPEFSGKFKSSMPPPGEYLQERDVLKQYVYRINLLGWISRQQFEETWMALLGVLSSTPVKNIDSSEEDPEKIQTSCLAVKSITSLLLQTMLLPQPGNPQNSALLIQSRDKPLALQHTKCGKKLLSVCQPIHSVLQNMQQLKSKTVDCSAAINTENVAVPIAYSWSQVSLEYLSATARLIEESEDLDGSISSNSSPVSASFGGILCFQLRDQCLASVGLDIHSCLHFLLDLYTQWLTPDSSSVIPLTLLAEVIKSIIALSDIFMEKSQFDWMLSTFLEVQRVHPPEDDIVSQYLIFGICKSAAVLGLEQDTLDRLKKLLDLNLRSTFIPTRISSLHGVLYLLECGAGEEFLSILPAVTTYLGNALEEFCVESAIVHNQDLVLILWASVFYIIENHQEGISDDEFVREVYQQCLTACFSAENDSSSCTFSITILHGLKRLLVTEILSGKEANLLLKLSVDRIRNELPAVSLSALKVFLFCMYIGKGTNMWEKDLVFDAHKNPESSLSREKQMESEFVLVALEQATALFDRIKKSYPFEAQIFCQVLPAFLIEFFPLQEILNKIITEFLSSQQSHPQMMAKVIFEVFLYLQKQSQQDIIHEWVLLSLSNFTQKTPLSLAIWSLNCLFLSATTNYWLQALFPFVQNRFGKMEEEDKFLFCLAGVNFRNQLQEGEQKEAFFHIIQSTALPNTPYDNLLKLL